MQISLCPSKCHLSRCVVEPRLDRKMEDRYGSKRQKAETKTKEKFPSEPSSSTHFTIEMQPFIYSRSFSLEITIVECERQFDFGPLTQCIRSKHVLRRHCETTSVNRRGQKSEVGSGLVAFVCSVAVCRVRPPLTMQGTASHSCQASAGAFA